MLVLRSADLVGNTFTLVDAPARRSAVTQLATN